MFQYQNYINRAFQHQCHMNTHNKVCLDKSINRLLKMCIRDRSSSVPESQSEPVENVDSEPEVIPLAAGLKSDPSASLLKTVSNDEVQIEQPEEGAQFQIYLASAGSYENAKETERDLLTTDSYGFARSKDLPYGLYVAHQTKGAEGQKFVPDFSVFISEHGKTYYFLSLIHI